MLQCLARVEAAAGVPRGALMPDWTEADRELEQRKRVLLDAYSAEQRDIIITTIFDFLGISFLIEYFQKEHREWWEHFIALITAAAYAEALWLLLTFLWVLLKGESTRAAIIAIIGEEGFVAFLKKLGKSWLFWLLVLDLLWTLVKAIQKWVESNAQLHEDLYTLYLTTEAPNRDAVFKANLGYIPEGG
jgi:hypothetical protein